MSERIHPTEVGQRVMEPYEDTKGWVKGFIGTGDDVEVIVTWDQPDVLDQEVGNFYRDELEAIPYLRIPTELFEDPALAPEVVFVRRDDQGQRVFRFVDGETAVSVVSARTHLVKLYTRLWA